MFECQAVGLNFAEGSSTAKARIASIRHKKMLYLGVDMHLLKCFAQYFGAHINDKSLCGSASTTIFEKTVSDPPPTISTHFNLHCDASRTSAHIYEQIDPYFIIDMDQSPLSPTHTSNSIGDIKIKCLQRLMDELSMIDSGFTTPTTHNRSCRHIVINSLGSEIELKKTQWMYRHVDPNGFHIHSHALFSVDNMSLQSCSSNRIRDDDSTRNANVELNEKRVEPPLDIIKQAEPNGSNKMRLHDPENTRNSTELLIAARESAQVSWWEHRTIRMDYPVDRVNPLSPTSTLADTRPNQETPFEKRTSLPISQGHPNEALHQHTRTVSATPSPYNHNHGTNTQSVGTISGQSRINSMPAITTGNTWLQLPCGSEPLKPESAVTKQVTRLVNELQFWKKSPGPLLRMPAHTTKNRGVRMQEPVQTIEEYRSLSTTPMIQEPATMEIVVKLWIRRTWWIDFCNFPDKT
ncbi:hypothetical protein BDEG_25193 [Batrachochytrium dendrobatidis JEL423]|nr:hypothetical protein BDEG_25193 [Batrachochytrium dendrobatidis JEL423]